MKNKTAAWRRRLADLFGVRPEDTGELVGQIDALRKKSGLFNERAMSMIEGVLRMSEWQVRDVMIPKNDIVGFVVDDGYDEVVAKICEWQHSRYPVFAADGEQVVGILLAKDLLKHAVNPGGFSLPAVMRAPVFAPLTRRLDNLLEDFRSSRSHLIVAVDEYQLPAGIVTFEDALEKIVGEIEDEYDDEDDRTTTTTADGSTIINGAMSVEEFNAEMSAHLPADGADTMAGWLAAEIGRIPPSGTKHYGGGFVFEVLAANDRRIRTIKVVPDTKKS